jgi:ABC-2 type transport system ATP-binding protein
VTLAGADGLTGAADALQPFADGKAAIDAEQPRVTIPVRLGTRLVEVVRALDAAGVDAIDVNRREATLDDVFLTLTGTQPEPVQAPGASEAIV